jgi:alkanesulfonate monooxygenase SsuD/methylene tetrahydromethanopterin reductase-like flavin-dependent oxidoreductase (luciferase family)
MSPQAFERAVGHANGWYGFHLDPERTRQAVDALAEAARRNERPAGLGPLELTITPPPGRVSRDDWKRYEDLGIARLVLLRGWPELQGTPAPGSAAEDALLGFLESSANELLGT